VSVLSYPLFHTLLSELMTADANGGRKLKFGVLVGLYEYYGSM